MAWKTLETEVFSDSETNQAQIGYKNINIHAIDCRSAATDRDNLL